MTEEQVIADNRRLLDFRLSHVEDVIKQVHHELSITSATAEEIVEENSIKLQHAVHVLNVILAWDYKRFPYIEEKK